MNQSESLIGVVKSILSWRKPILLVTALAVIGTAVISLFLPNYYEAKTVFYAASSDRLRPELLYSNDISIPLYGNQNDIDRLLSIGESRDLVDFVIDSFKLFEHYNITPDNERARYNLEQTFLSHYTIKKNKLDAIEIIFEDKDKAFALQLQSTFDREHEVLSHVERFSAKRKSNATPKSQKNSKSSKRGKIDFFLKK